jgi:plastocyanin
MEGTDSMNALKLIIIVAAAMLFSLANVSAGIEDKDKGKIVPAMNIKEVKIIRVNAIAGVNPAELTIERGTTVIWINESESSVEMQFEGKQVTMACKNPVHFVVDEKGFFKSDRIPAGSVASMCFVEKGEFNYVMRKVLLFSPTLEPRPYNDNFRGKIIVK